MRAKVELRRHDPSRDMLNFSQGQGRVLNQPGRITYFTTRPSSDETARPNRRLSDGGAHLAREDLGLLLDYLRIDLAMEIDGLAVGVHG